MAAPLPPLDVPVVDRNGIMSQAWYSYFQSHQKLFSFLTYRRLRRPTDQVLIYNSTTKLWVPGAN
jgi:hypothetical protein